MRENVQDGEKASERKSEAKRHCGCLHSVACSVSVAIAWGERLLSGLYCFCVLRVLSLRFGVLHTCCAFPPTSFWMRTGQLTEDQAWTKRHMVCILYSFSVSLDLSLLLHYLVQKLKAAECCVACVACLAETARSSIRR